MRTRTVTCTSSDGKRIRQKDCELDTSSLSLATESCGFFPCQPVLLRIGDWSECSCESGTQTRNVDCVSQDNTEVPMSRCEAQVTEIPGTERDCQSANCRFAAGTDAGGNEVVDTASRRLLQEGNIPIEDPCAGMTCSGISPPVFFLLLHLVTGE